MPTHQLTHEIINAAVEGFEQQKLRIDAQIAELRQMLDGHQSEPASTPAVPTGKRRKMSAAARKRIGDAQRKRWAESRGGAEAVSETVAARPKRKMSAAGRKAISDATKKRWAAFHAAKKKLAPAAKKGTVKAATAVKSPVRVAATKAATA